MPVKILKTSYNAGLLSGYMDGRTDINKYYNGCSELINGTILPHGGVVKRSGTQYIATAPNRANLLPFEFSVDDALILEFSNLLMRQYKNQAIVNDNAGTETIPTGNIVAHWLLNEQNGVTAADDDGGTHDGTISVDAVTITSTGKVNTGFDLDGQYDVTVADSNDFSFNNGTDGGADATADSAFSLVSWGKVTNKGGVQVLLSKWRDANVTREWRLSLSSDKKLQLHLADTSAGLKATTVAQWKLNETGSSAVLDNAEGTVALDATASQNADTANFSQTGIINTCFDWDATHFATVSDDAALSFDDSGSNPVSIAAWVFVTNTGIQQTIFSKWEATGDAEYRFYLDPSEKLNFDLWDKSASAGIFNKTTDALSIGWHLVTVTYDSTGGANAETGIIMYVDNASVAFGTTKSGTYSAMENTTTDVLIGAQLTSGTESGIFADKIDNVMLFGTAILSTADIGVLYNSGSGTETIGVAEISIVSDSAISTGWHLFSCTYDGTGGATAANGVILYVDGAVVNSTGTNNANYTAMQNDAEEVRIGSQRNSGDSANENFWEDEIDEVSVFSDVLTSTEVAVLYSTSPFSIISPYTSAQAFEIHVTQSADVMYIAHEDHHPKKLSRLGSVDWTLVDVPFTGGPFLEDNTTDASLLGFARTGGTARSEYYFPAGSIGTLTATGTDNQPFNSNMVGALWLIKHTRDNDNKTTTFAKDTNVVPTLETFASGAIFIKGDYTLTLEPVATGKSARLWRKQGGAPWQEFRSFVGTSAFSATEKENNVLYAMTRSDNTVKGTLTAKEQINRGVVKITGFTSSTVVTVEVIGKVLSNNTNDNAVTTFQWAEGAWSDFRGYPRTVTFFEDRLWWASSTNNPDTLWSSQSGLYENMEFSDIGLASDAITAPLNDNEVSQIQWMQARQVLAVGAANKEYKFGASDPDKSVTPADRKSTPQTSFGSDNIQPAVLNNAIFFFQRQGRKLRAMKFDAITENFDAEDATLLAYDLFESAPTNMAVQRVPDAILWAVRTDGILPTFTFEPDEEVSGWAKQIFGNSADVETATGFVESVAVIHGSAEDEVWVNIRRVINSSTVYYTEKFKPRLWGDDIEDAFFVDAGITYDSTATTTITGLDHLEGETVAVFADGLVQDTKVVASGQIMIVSASTVQVGLPYTMKVRTMRLAVPESQTLQTRIKRVSKTAVRFIRSLLGSAGQEYAGVEYLQDLNATFSNKSKDNDPDTRLAQGGFSEDAFTTIVSDDPVPFTVLATIIDVEI